VVVGKMAAGRNCRQHDKALHDMIVYCREIQEHMQHITAPGPLTECWDPVNCTGFTLLSSALFPSI